MAFNPFFFPCHASWFSSLSDGMWKLLYVCLFPVSKIAIPLFFLGNESPFFPLFSQLPDSMLLFFLSPPAPAFACWQTPLTTPAFFSEHTLEVIVDPPSPHPLFPPPFFFFWERSVTTMTFLNRSRRLLHHQESRVSVRGSFLRSERELPSPFASSEVLFSKFACIALFS